MKFFSNTSIQKFGRGVFYGAITSEGAGVGISLMVGDGFEGAVGAAIHQPIVDILTLVFSPVHQFMQGMTGGFAPSTSAGGFGW